MPRAKAKGERSASLPLCRLQRLSPSRAAVSLGMLAVTEGTRGPKGGARHKSVVNAERGKKNLHGSAPLTAGQSDVRVSEGQDV